MKESRKFQVILLLGLVGFASHKYWYKPPSSGDPIASTTIHLPSFFTSWAKLVRDDSENVLKTTEDWRNAYFYSAKFLLNGPDYTKVETRGGKIDKIITDAITLENQAFTPALKTALADALDQIAVQLKEEQL